VLEKTLVNHIRDIAKAHGILAVKIHGGPYQQAGLPDLLLLYRGHAAWIEAKLLGNKATPLQRLCLDNLAKAGCPAIVATSTGTAQEFIEAWTGEIDRASMTFEATKGATDPKVT
jgi:hypothetical protein